LNSHPPNKLTALEKRWLQYARALISDVDHKRECERLGGASELGPKRQRRPSQNLDINLRWPGYIGAGYEAATKRILCIGQVHFGKMLAATLGHIEPTLCELVKVDAANEVKMFAILQTIRAGYQRALKTWGPWSNRNNGFQKILQQKYGAEHIAYVNLARCWQTPTDTSMKAVIKACLATHPISDLTKAIKPDLLLIRCGMSYLDYATSGIVWANTHFGNWAGVECIRFDAKREDPATIEAIRKSI